MKNSSKPEKFSPDLPEPTDEQIKAVAKMAKEKHGIEVPKNDARKLAALIAELSWWINLDDDSTYSSRTVSDEQIAELKGLMIQEFGKEVTDPEAQKMARGLLTIVPYKEKQRLSEEIRAVLVTHREVVPNSDVEEKTAELFKLQYDIELTHDQLWQIVQFLSRTLWYEEGLDKSLGKCLDDLLVIADKQKRGKKVSGVELHEKITQAVDMTAQKLTYNEIDRVSQK